MKKVSDNYQSFGYVNYTEYLNSEHWKLKREQYKQSTRPQFCVMCGEEDYVLHHTSYKNVGKEPLSDLLPLCNNCHVLVHSYIDKNNLSVEQTSQAIFFIERDFDRQSVYPISEYVRSDVDNGFKKLGKARRFVNKRISVVIEAEKHGDIIRRIQQEASNCSNCYIVAYVKNIRTYMSKHPNRWVQKWATGNAVELRLISGTSGCDYT